MRGVGDLAGGGGFTNEVYPGAAKFWQVAIAPTFFEGEIPPKSPVPVMEKQLPNLRARGARRRRR